MEKIELKDTKTARDCIVVWKYIKDNDCNYESLTDCLKDKLLRNGYFVIQETLRRLSEIGAINIFQPKDSRGKWKNTTYELLKEPVLRNKNKSDKKMVSCIECGELFKEKLAKSKYKDLCHICTGKKFMSSPDVKCDYCSDFLPKNKSVGHWHKIYHEVCYNKYIDDVKKLKENEKEERKKCNVCGKEKESGLRGKCKKCREDSKNINKKVCCYCKSNYIGALCDNNNCVAIDYCKKDALFRGAYLNAQERGRSIKAQIIGVRCELCGYDKILQYHHVIFRENGGSDNLSNIIALCPNHHMEVHHCGLDISEEHKKVLQRMEDIKNSIITINTIDS